MEFGEYDLVRESLRERAILLQTAPEFVRPLRFFIPVEHRFTGLMSAAARFLHLPWTPAFRGRGRYVVQMGLTLYDRFAQQGNNTLPRHAVHSCGKSRAGSAESATSGVSVEEMEQLPQVGRPGTRWLLSYSDAQVQFPERFTIAMLKDAVAVARERGIRGEVFAYHTAVLSGADVEISPVVQTANRPSITAQPAAIINATGAWVDETLQRLRISSPRLIGGTKGSHFFTWQPKLRELLRGQAVYAEASDGRPVFVLPFGDGVLVGTTDLPFAGDPATAFATEEELSYLLTIVNDLFPTAAMNRADIMLHGCGVRPLPYVGTSTPAGVTRRHWLHWHDAAAMPLVSIIGGKLTTCRSLAEETAAEVAKRLGRSFTAGATRTRLFPEEPMRPQPDNLADITADTIAPFVTTEFATQLEDLIERRLMWLYHPQLTRRAIEQLAAALVKLNQLSNDQRDPAVTRAIQRLQQHFGRLVQ